MAEEWWDKAVKQTILDIDTNAFETSDALSEAIIVGISEKYKDGKSAMDNRGIGSGHLEELILEQLLDRVQDEGINLSTPHLTESTASNVMEKLEVMKEHGLDSPSTVSLEPWWDDVKSEHDM